MNITTVILIIQLVCGIIAALYFATYLRDKRTVKVTTGKGSERELEKLRRLRACKLTVPLSERTRPKSLDDIIGQEEGIRALKAALCGENPQHVIIYGPPGVGKTCAARQVLEEAKKYTFSPFRKEAKFIEIDATCVRFDERAIADPLLGSVHDPIYQGAGAMGIAGVPQPKQGAVTKANGGVLFLDEIGELHPIQMNKLLKVLEDRTVYFESAYYNQDDKNTPPHIHDIFKNGLPADFRLVGATTCRPEDLPPALRSRCLEIYFRALKPSELSTIAINAAKKSGAPIDQETAEFASRYCQNGREIVNMIQLAAGIASSENREDISKDDIEWVAETCRYHARGERKLAKSNHAGVVNGLAVSGDGQGVVMEIEALAHPSARGSLCVTGIVDQEEIGGKTRKLRRQSTAKSSVENVLTALRSVTGLDGRKYDLHINFPGGTPVDGPSAGAAVALAVYSALTGIPVDQNLALTGEISIYGTVKPVGGVSAKIEAAVQAGATTVLIPKDNYKESYAKYPIDVVPVKDILEIIKRGCDVLEINRLSEKQLYVETSVKTAAPV